jgi:murein DD-endopeptidase MepM/ murein hydrolase activator NlpD
VRAVFPYKRVAHAAPKRVVAVLACAVGIVALAPAAAQAQTGGAGIPAPTPTPTAPAPAPTITPSGQVFPVPGPHTYGDGFGAGRGHRGADVMAACGEPLVAVTWARVIFVGKHRRAGNYMVIRNKKLRQDFAYMHLAGPPLVGKKAKVHPGQLLGYVGDTGNASTCHLHFELWVGRWYRGGRAVDPMPHLQTWDAYS